MGRSLLAASLLSLAVACAPCRARAGGLVPNGDPIDGPPVAFPDGSSLAVTLYPNPAEYVAPQDSEWLLQALEAQGYKPGNISYSTLAGSYSNDSYYAFANETPSIQRYGMSVKSRPVPGAGGAALSTAPHK